MGTLAHIVKVMRRHWRTSGVPGAAIAITDRNRLVHAAGFGWADPARRIPFTARTIMPVGSVGKPFTSLVLHRLARAGKVVLDAPVARYLPWFRVRAARPVTVRHLMSHAAGIPMGSDLAPWGAKYDPAALAGFRAAWTPGTRFHYSNTGYKALGYVIERVTGRPLRETYEREILRPLGMRRSFGAVDGRVRGACARGYWEWRDDMPRGRDRRLDPAPWTEYYGGDGAIVSCAEDLCALARLYLQRRETVDETGAMRCWGTARYASGWLLSRVGGHATIGHGGSHPGFCSCLSLDLDGGYGVAVVCNGPWGWFPAYDLVVYALKLLAGSRAKSPRIPKPAREPRSGRVPPRWAAIAGTYRAHNPWLPVIRVTVRRGRLVVTAGPEEPARMWPAGARRFKVGDTRVTPETLLFDTPVEGRFQRAVFSGTPLYRIS